MKTKLIDLATKEKLKEYEYKNKSKKNIIKDLCPEDLGINDSLEKRITNCRHRCEECWNLEMEDEDETNEI